MKIVITESQLNRVMSEMGKPLTDEEKKERLDKIKKLAVGFENPRQFFLKYPEEYYFIRGNDYVDEVFPNRKKYKPDGYWNSETISKEAEKYNSKSEFNRGNQVAYNKAVELGILDMLFPFNLPLGTFSKGAPIKWTLEKSLEHAKNFDGTRSEFTKKHFNAYKVLRDNNLWDDIKFKNSTNDERKKLVDLAKDYESPKQMKRLNPELHNILLKKGLLYKLFDLKSTLEKRLEQAREYENKYDLYNKNKALYYKLSKMGVLDKVYKESPNKTS